MLAILQNLMRVPCATASSASRPIGATSPMLCSSAIRCRVAARKAGLRYWCSVCPACSMKAQCTTGKERRVKRWEHEATLEAMQARLDRDPDKMRVRRQTVEHPFGTIKSWMGSTHFLTKTLDRVSTEMSLHVLAYNLKRVMQILGVGPLLEAMRMSLGALFSLRMALIIVA